MKKLRKRIISMLLVVVLAVSLLPAGAFAVYDPGDLDPIEDGDGNSWFPLGENSGLEYAYYGRTYIEDGALVTEAEIVIRIDSDYAGSPTHKIPDYENETDRPWVPKDTGVYLRVYIEDGVKGIGSNAFSNMQYTSEFVIEAPTDLEYIGENAFSGGGMNGGATFTTGLPNATTEGSLDLSNVETIGANAFNGCSQLEKVTLGGDLNAIESGEPTEHKIADGAFAGTGLTEITIPAGVTAIGDRAFANPSGDGFITLVIPENVTAIGESAFSGHGRLGKVEIYAGKNVAITVGNDAFANCGTEAGADITGYTDEDLKGWDFKTGKLPEGTGTQFNNVRPLFLFQHDENMPDNLSALEGKSPPDGVSAMYLSSESTAADCTTPGYNGYVFYKEDDIDGDKYNYVEILPALGHQYDTGGVEVDEDETEAEEDKYTENDTTYIEAPTCELPRRWVLECTRKGCDHEHVETIVGTGAVPALGHDYKVTEITTVDGTTTITYVCKNDKQHDGEEAQTVKYAAKNGSIRVLTTDTLAQVMTRLTQFQKIDSKIPPLGGTLSWNFDSMSVENDASTMYEAGYREENPNSVLHLIFDPDDNSRDFPTTGTDDNDDNEKLTIPVTVEKDVLDLSQIGFTATTQYYGEEQRDVTLTQEAAESLSGAAIDSSRPATYHDYNTGDEIQRPDNDIDDSGIYKVRLYFKYDNKGEFRLPNSNESEALPDGYTAKEDADGTGFYIECDYIVDEPDISRSGVTPSNREFNSFESTAFRVWGVPLDDDNITVTYKLKGEDTETLLKRNPDGYFYGPAISKAGTYNYIITISAPDYETKSKILETTATISAKPIDIPSSNNYTYAPNKTHTGVIYGGTEPINNEDVTFYTFTEGEESDTGMTFDGAGNATAINAGDYVVTAELTYPDSTYWAGTENDNTNKNIEWSISPIEVPVPTANTDLVYNNKLKTGITQSGSNFELSWSNGNGIGLYKYGENLTETAYTVTNGQATDGGTYTATATLDPSGNYVWADKTTDDKKIEWTIYPMPVNVADYVTVDAGNVPYDGNFYEDSNVEVDASNADGQIFESVFDSYTLTYSTENPTNAGSYTVRVTFTGYNADNFSLDYGGFTPASFDIIPVTLTMAFDEEEQKAVFTESGTALQKVSVTGGGSLTPQPGKDYTIIYSYRYKADANAGWTEEDVWKPISNPDTQVFEDTGFYEIKAEMSGVNGVENYTASPASYTLTITKSSQSITLSPDDENRWTAAEGDTPKYTITYGDAETFTVTGTPALDDAQISYEVTEGDGVITADGAEMTILKPGDATVTVKAEATDNADSDETSYTVTVNEATPNIEIDESALEDLQYDGNKLEKSDIDDAVILSGAGDGYEAPSGTWTAEFYKYTSDDEKADLLDGTSLLDPMDAIAQGTYWVKVTYDGSSDEYYGNAVAVGKVTIVPAALTAEVEDYTGDYNGEEHDLAEWVRDNISYSHGGTPLTDDQKASLSITFSDQENGGYSDELTRRDATAGAVTYYYKVTDSSGNFGDFTGSFTATINPAELELSSTLPDILTKPYDGSTALPGNAAPEDTSEGIVYSDRDNVEIEVSAEYADKNAAAEKEIKVTYKITFSGNSADNYSYDGDKTESTENSSTVWTVTVTAGETGTIEPKGVDVTLPKQVMTYNGTAIFTAGSAITGSIDSDDIFADDTVTATVAVGTRGNLDSKDVAENVALTISPDDVKLSNDNYEVETVTAYVEITKATPSIEFGPDITTDYTGSVIDVSEYQTAEVTGVGGETGSTVGTVSYAIEDETGASVDPDELIAAGTYTVTAKLTPGGNYESIDPVRATLTVSASALDVTSPDYSGEYDGQPHDVTGGWTVTGVGNATIHDFTVYFASKETYPERPDTDDAWQSMPFTDVADSGEYWYKVTAASHDPAFGEVNIEIEPYKLTLTAEVMPARKYDGTTDSSVTKVNSSEYNGTVSLPGVSGESFTLTASAAYDDPDAGNDKPVTVTYTVDESSTAELGNYAFTNGTYHLTVDGNTIKDTSLTAGIDPKKLDVVLNGTFKAVYDGDVPELDGITCDVGDQLADADDDPKITLSLPDDAIAASDEPYTITVNIGNGNYTLGTAENTDFTIFHRPIDVTIKDYSTYYGEARPGQDELLELETFSDGSGLVDGDELYLMDKIDWGSVSETANSGPYTVTGADGVVDNYDVDFTWKDDNYVINRRPITVKILDQSIERGQSIESETNINRNEGDIGAVEGKNYTVALDAGPTGDALVNNDKLGLILITDALDYSDVGDYDVKPSVSSNITRNYDITWSGNGTDRTLGKLTINPARLAIAFEQNDKGFVADSFTNTFRNPLIYTNLSNGQTIPAGTFEDLYSANMHYTLTPAAGSEGFAEIDKHTGELTIHSPGQGTIRVQAIFSDGENYETSNETYYTLSIIDGAYLRVNFAQLDLTYNGREQALLGEATVYDRNGNEMPEDSYTIEYRLTRDDGTELPDAEWSTEVPTGDTAGDYTVEYQIRATGNTPIPTPINVTIEQAELEGFANDEISRGEYTNGMTITQADNPLSLTAANGAVFEGTVDYSTTRDDVATVETLSNSEYTVTMHGETPSNGITIYAEVSGDDNFVSQTYSYTLIVNQSAIDIDVDGDGGFTYDGKPHGLTVTVPSLDAIGEGYTVVFGTSAGNYTTTECPEYTDVGNYTIYFEVRPDNTGYQTAPGSATIEITPKDINTETYHGTPDVTASGVAETYTYMGGQSIEPPVTVYDSVIKRELVKGTDYELDYANNTEVSEDGEYATITVTGIGNYDGELKQVLRFRIVSVQSGYMWAELTENYGILDSTDGSTSTTVEVFHGSDEKLDPDGGSDFFEITVTGTDLKGGEITVSEEDINNATGEITFRTPGTYSITVEVSGNHSGEFDLSYALLPMQSENGFELSAGSTSGAQVITYGESVTDLITVEINDQPLSEVNGDYTLSYVYTPFVGDPAGSQDYNNELAGKPAAGVYEITATGGAAYHGVTGSFVCLVQQRDIADIDDENVTISSVGEYDGHEKKPDVELSFDGEYVSITTEPYNNINAGTAQVVSTADAGSNNFTGTRVDTFEIAKADISNVDRFTVGEIDEQDYTGFPVVPEVTITDSARPEGEKTLIYGQDYTTKAANDGSPSTEAKAVITGTGNYCDTREVTFTITSEPTPDPDANFDLIVEPREWTWGSAPDDLRISVTFEEGKELAPEHYRLTIDGTGYTIESAAAFLKSAEPGSYTVEANGTGAYEPSSDSETVNVKKIQPVLNIEATPTSLTGSGSITLTLSGSGLPDGTVLSKLLTPSAQNGTELDLSSAEWTANADGSLTAELRLPNANETYTFTLSFPGDVYHEPADDTATVVTARRTSGGGGGGGSTAYTITAEAEEGGIISPDGETAVVRGDDQSFAIRADSGWHIEDVLVDGKSVGAVSSYTFENVTRDHTITAVFAEGQVIADPDETGVSDWLNTSDHMAYMQGYPDGTFGPQKNMTRAEAAQMFYNLLLDKDVRITAEFTDVNDGAWYAEAVNALASLGMINGVGDSRFEPERSITRAEFTAIAMRFAELDTDGENIFSDVGENDWFYDVVVGSIKYGWINGYSDGTFRPDETITRAEVATITNRMLGRAADEDYVDGRSDALRSFIDLSDRHWAYYNVMEATNEHEYEREDGVETWTRLG